MALRRIVRLYRSQLLPINLIKNGGITGEINAKKLLYVLASRARKNLHLVSEKMRGPFNFYNPQGKKPTPHLLEYIYEYDDL